MKKRSYYVTEIKKAIFSVFGVSHLDEIKEKDGVDEIRAWKQSEKTRWCREHLGQWMNSNDQDSTTFLEVIYSKVYSPADQTSNNAAFTIAIAEAMLDSDTTTTIMSKEIILQRMRKGKSCAIETTTTTNKHKGFGNISTGSLEDNPNDSNDCKAKDRKSDKDNNGNEINN